MNKKVRKKYTTILNSMKNNSQNYKILKHLLEHDSITTFEAF